MHALHLDAVFRVFDIVSEDFVQVSLVEPILDYCHKLLLITALLFLFASFFGLTVRPLPMLLKSKIVFKLSLFLLELDHFLFLCI